MQSAVAPLPVVTFTSVPFLSNSHKTNGKLSLEYAATNKAVKPYQSRWLTRLGCVCTHCLISASDMWRKSGEHSADGISSLVLSDFDKRLFGVDMDGLLNVY